MRVLLVGNFLSRHGGVRGVCEELSERLEAQGHQVLRTSSRHGRILRFLDMTWTIRRRRTDYDVAQIDLYSGTAFLWGEAAARALSRHGKPYVVTLHGGGLPQLAHGKRDRLRRVLQGAAHVTAPSAFLARALAPVREDIQVLPNALDLERYPFRIRDEARPHFVWLRAFHAIYQPELAVRCLHALLPEHPQARLMMIGPDKGDGSLARVRTLVRALGVERQVRIDGGVAKDEVGRALARGDIFLNTSRVDNAPVTVVEAMACGLCVVSTRAGGLGDLVRDGETGLLVPADDPAALAGAAYRILTEPRLAGGLSRGGRAEAERHDWGHVLPRWEALLAEAIDAAA